MLKIVKMAMNCKECPQRAYYSAGRYECLSMGGAPLPGSCDIPAWCPLQDYPLQAMALAHNLLDPEMYGYAVTAEVRDAARRALGLRPVEAGKHSNLG